jgi:hypothetical protein
MPDGLPIPPPLNWGTEGAEERMLGWNAGGGTKRFPVNGALGVKVRAAGNEGAGVNAGCALLGVVRVTGMVVCGTCGVEGVARDGSVRGSTVAGRWNGDTVAPRGERVERRASTVGARPGLVLVAGSVGCGTCGVAGVIPVESGRVPVVATRVAGDAVVPRGKGLFARPSAVVSGRFRIIGEGGT